MLHQGTYLPYRYKLYDEDGELIDKSEEREDTVIRDATIDDIYDWENDYVYIHL